MNLSQADLTSYENNSSKQIEAKLVVTYISDIVLERGGDKNNIKIIVIRLLVQKKTINIKNVLSCI